MAAASPPDLDSVLDGRPGPRPGGVGLLGRSGYRGPVPLRVGYLLAERDARTAEAETAQRRVAELEDELTAARESLRRVIRSTNR